MILSNPLFSMMVDSSMNIEITGAIPFSPGFLNQTVIINAKEKLNNITFKSLFFTKRDNKKLIKKERDRYISQNKIIKSLR